MTSLKEEIQKTKEAYQTDEVKRALEDIEEDIIEAIDRLIEKERKYREFSEGKFGVSEKDIKEIFGDFNR